MSRSGRWTAGAGTTAPSAAHDPLPLATQYPKVAGITGRVWARTGLGATVYLGATGVGLPVVDLLRERLHGGRVVAVYFTHGDRGRRPSRGDKCG